MVVPVVWVALSLLFFLFFIVPGDPVSLLGGERAVNATTRHAVEAKFGLDKPWYVQYERYWERLAHGDLASPGGEEPVLRRQHAPGHPVEDHGQAGRLRQPHQLPLGAGPPHAPAGHHGGPLGLADQACDPRHLVGVRRRPGVGRGDAFDGVRLLEEDVGGDVQEGGAGAPAERGPYRLRRHRGLCNFRM